MFKIVSHRLEWGEGRFAVTFDDVGPSSLLGQKQVYDEKGIKNTGIK